MPANVAKKDVPCILCDFKSRSDHVKRHVKLTHNNHPVPAGWEAVPGKPTVLVQPYVTNGATKAKEGVCLQCGSCIKNIIKDGGKGYVPPGFAIFLSHNCRDKQVRAMSDPTVPKVARQAVVASPATGDSYQGLFEKFKAGIKKYPWDDNRKRKIHTMCLENLELYSDDDKVDYEKLLLCLLDEFAQQMPVDDDEE
jgi:hypothetical protein